MIKLFCGYDSREALGFHVFVASVLRHASAPVSIVALDSKGLPQGSNSFTLSRFLVPYLMNYEGRAIFADASDMLMLDDVAKLDSHFDDRYALQVVQHPTYATQHRIKYQGTDMQCPNVNYARKNWASLMLINCGHPVFPALWAPGRLAEGRPLPLLQMEGIDDSLIGALPDRWNRLVDEGHPVDNAGIAHWTAGIPGFAFYANAPGADLWHAQCAELTEVTV